jgi:hypothetical protein
MTMTDTLTETREPALEDLDIPAPAQLPAFSEGLGSRAPVLTEAGKAFLPISLEDIRAVAGMLACLPGAREGFKDNPKACEAIVLQAALWRVSPLFVLQCAYQAKKDGPIGYESKLLHAVLLANGPLSRRPRLQYGYSDPNSRIAANRFCKATFWVVGEDEPITVTSPTTAQIKIKNSPEWFSNLDLQLGYYTFRMGGRLHFPDVLGGAYTREEVIYMRSIEHDAPRGAMFEDDAEAEFEDKVAPTATDAAAYDRAKNKADGVQDSRDPRDDPRNKVQDADVSEPDDAQEVREWAFAEQARILKMDGVPAVQTAWSVAILDKKWKRLKSYQQPIANTIRERVEAHVKALKAGADTSTGEVR